MRATLTSILRSRTLRLRWWNSFAQRLGSKEPHSQVHSLSHSQSDSHISPLCSEWEPLAEAQGKAVSSWDRIQTWFPAQAPTTSRCPGHPLGWSGRWASLCESWLRSSLVVWPWAGARTSLSLLSHLRKGEQDPHHGRYHGVIMGVQQDGPHELVGTGPGTSCEGPGHAQFWVPGVPSLP